MVSLNMPIGHTFAYYQRKIGPIIAGAMSQGVGWRSFWWFNVAVNSFVFFAVLIGFPETKWHRSRKDEVEVGVEMPVNPSINSSKEMEHDSPGSKSSAIYQLPASDRQHAGVFHEYKNTHVGKGSPSKSQWNLLQPSEKPLESLTLNFLLPCRLLLYPIVQFASFVVSFSSTCYLMITFVQSEALGKKPYQFNPQIVGFTDFASLVGAFIGLLTAGPASDIVSATLTKRNNGIREPEMRLMTMIPYVLIMILGNFVVGFGLQYSWNWRVCSTSKSCRRMLIIIDRQS